MVAASIPRALLVLLVLLGAGEFRVSVLDSFELMEGALPVSLPGSGERLLAFLALAGVPLRRCFVAGNLWPEASERHAFGNLRSTLARLGGSGRRAIAADSHRLRLVASASVDIQDARALSLRLLAPGPKTSADLSRRTLAVLSAELLPGWYDDWVIAEAARWRQLRLHALEAFADHLLRAERFGEAADVAGVCVDAEPLRESAHASLIRVHLAEGNRSEALRQLQRLREILGSELNIQPGPRVTALFASGEDRSSSTAGVADRGGASVTPR
jgi:DNA-binding SARP family transcriptional activator